jgi:hypothetical protein
MDAVTFGPLDGNQSQGHYPDGTGVIQVFALATPALRNAVPPPPPPPPAQEPCFLPGIPISGSVSLWGAAANELSFWLEPGAPSGVTVQRKTGVFEWTPALDQPGGAYSFNITVCDLRPGRAPQTAAVKLTLQPALRFLGAPRKTAEGLEIPWEGPTCIGAKLQYRENLQSGDWQLLPDRFQATSGINHLLTRAPERTGYYRLVLAP